MISIITPAMRAAEERPIHWSELEDAPARCPPADYEPSELCECGCYPCECAMDHATAADWYYDIDRDDRNDGCWDDGPLDHHHHLRGYRQRRTDTMTDSKPTFRAYRIGLSTASVCTNLPAASVAERMNLEHPTGIDSLWALSTDATFSGGEPNPCPCPDSLTHKHYLLEC